MEPDDDALKRVLPAVGVLTTVIYSGPVTRLGRLRSQETAAESNDTVLVSVERMEGERLVRYVLDNDTGRLFRKE
jgi:hypothetical protein